MYSSVVAGLILEHTLNGMPYQQQEKTDKGILVWPHHGVFLQKEGLTGEKRPKERPTCLV
jgi:hypothetical protein